MRIVPSFASVSGVFEDFRTIIARHRRKWFHPLRGYGLHLNNTADARCSASGTLFDHLAADRMSYSPDPVAEGCTDHTICEELPWFRWIRALQHWSRAVHHNL